MYYFLDIIVIRENFWKNGVEKYSSDNNSVFLRCAVSAKMIENLQNYLAWANFICMCGDFLHTMTGPTDTLPSKFPDLGEM